MSSLRGTNSASWSRGEDESIDDYELMVRVKGPDVQTRTDMQNVLVPMHYVQVKQGEDEYVI